MKAWGVLSPPAQPPAVSTTALAVASASSAFQALRGQSWGRRD